MKHLKKTSRLAASTLTLFLLFIISSCQESSVAPAERQFGGTMTAQVNGTVVSLSQISITVGQGGFALETKGTTTSFYIYFTNAIGIAKTTYDIGTQDTGINFSYGDGGKYYANSLTKPSKLGEFVITEIDEVGKTMSGTFQAVLPNTDDAAVKMTIANGVFTKVPYLIYKNKSGDTHLAKIDGVELKGNLRGTSTGSMFRLEYANEYKALELVFPLTQTPVTYDIAKFTDPYSSLIYVDGLYSYKAKTGSIVITAVNAIAKTIEGTYTGVAESIPVSGTTKQITEGTFSVTYP